MTKNRTKPPSDYAVGYGRPPAHSRFQPGQSGNPRGRPRQRGPVTIDVDALMLEPVKVTQDGKARWMAPREIALRQTLKKALKGEVRAIAHILREFERYGAIAPPVVTRGGVLVVPRGIPIEFGLTLLAAYGPPPWSQHQIASLEPAYIAARSAQEEGRDRRAFK
jgi:hypothetical protein